MTAGLSRICYSMRMASILLMCLIPRCVYVLFLNNVNGMKPLIQVLKTYSSARYHRQDLVFKGRSITLSGCLDVT